jgi:hypothetical protein
MLHSTVTAAVPFAAHGALPVGTRCALRAGGCSR